MLTQKNTLFRIFLSSKLKPYTLGKLVYTAASETQINERNLFLEPAGSNGADAGMHLNICFCLVALSVTSPQRGLHRFLMCYTSMSTVI